MRIREWAVSAAALLLAVAATVAAPAAAFAQGDDDDAGLGAFSAEFYCAFDMLSLDDGANKIADVWVDDNAEQADIDKADGLLSKAISDCADSYGWNETLQDYASTVAIHGSVVETLTGDMVLEGMTEEQVEAVFSVVDGLEPEDVDKFSESTWLADDAFEQRMHSALVKAGVPNDEKSLKDSMYVMESSVVAANAILKWMDAKADAAPEGPVPRKARAGGSSNKKSKKSNKSTPRAPKLQLAATGTGWYVAPGGYLVTNAHVVEDCKLVTLKGGAELEVLDVQEDEDLALLKGVSSVDYLVLRDGRNARLAEDVLVAGYPLGGILSSGINVTVGTVSALAGMGDDDRRFQFTAPVQPGNSGGPVLDSSGHVIGVVVAKLNAMSIQDEVGDIPQNVNFGIQLPRLLSFLNGNNVPYERQASGKTVDKVDLAEMARASTVLLQCYQ